LKNDNIFIYKGLDLGLAGSEESLASKFEKLMSREAAWHTNTFFMYMLEGSNGNPRNSKFCISAWARGQG